MSDKFTRRIIDYNKVLKKYFGYDALKGEQEIIVDKIVKFKRDVCAVLCTGFGKSICYQLPALITNKCSIVVSPLISLMADQQFKLEKIGINSCCINSTCKNKKIVMNDVINGKYNIVYITPESVECYESFFIDLMEHDRMGVIAIDESHCISTWGFDFRDSYTKLNKLREWCPNVPILALTATATKKVRNDICNMLNLKNPKMIVSGFDRPNLFIGVQRKTDLEIDMNILKKYKDKKVIIYCKTRDGTEKISEKLNELGINTDYYHAGMSEKNRDSVQKKFTKGHINCIVATVAFGMGIDISDIRLIIHYGCPKNLESYYQEIGRGGRDGIASECIMFYDNKDMMLNNMFISDIQNKEYRAYQEQAIKTMEKYVHTMECRRKVLLKHFDEDNDKLPDKCNNCDNCKKETQKKDFTFDSYLCLSLIKDNSEKVGICMFVDTLRGGKGKKLYDTLKKSPYYGLGKHLSAEKWKELIDILTTNDYVYKKQISKFGSVIGSTDKANAWIKTINKNYKSIDSRTLFAIEHRLLFSFASDKIAKNMTEKIVEIDEITDDFAIDFYDMKTSESKPVKIHKKKLK